MKIGCNFHRIKRGGEGEHIWNFINLGGPCPLESAPDCLGLGLVHMSTSKSICDSILHLIFVYILFSLCKQFLGTSQIVGCCSMKMHLAWWMHCVSLKNPYYYLVLLLNTWFKIMVAMSIAVDPNNRYIVVLHNSSWHESFPKKSEQKKRKLNLLTHACIYLGI